MPLRFVTFLMATAFFEQVTTTLVRVTITYRAVELDLSVVWIGIMTAAFAMLPIGFAVPVGRFIDRGNDARTAWIGGGLQVAACSGLALFPSLAGLLFFTAILGLGHLMLVIAQQVLCTRVNGVGAMERMLGNYMLANAIGQGVGPYIVGWTGGDASIPPTQMLFFIGIGASCLSALSALMLRSPGTPTPPVEGSRPMPVRDIVSLPGIKILFFVSLVTVAAQDLIVVYMPLLGAERGWSVDTVGLLLTVRAVASMVSRLTFAWLNGVFGNQQLMTLTTYAGAASYIAVAVPMPFVGMSVVIAIAGFSLGVAVTVSIAGLLALARPEARGTANSLRMMGNRLGQFTIPVVAGLIAAAAGVASIFLMLGASLAVSAAAVQFGRRRT
jgi:MFS family permease